MSEQQLQHCVAIPRTRDVPAQGDYGALSGTALNAVSLLNQQSGTQVLTQWLNDRMDHCADAGSNIEDAIQNLLDSKATYTDYEALDHCFVTLEDGRILQFEWVSPNLRDPHVVFSLRVWVGEEYSDIPVRFDTETSEHLPEDWFDGRIQLPEPEYSECADKLRGMLDCISDCTDSSLEVMEYARNLSNALLQDGASANLILSQGMNGATDAIKELASAVGSVPVASRYSSLMSYIMGSLSANGKAATEASEEDPDAGVFDITTYQHTATVSLITGAWTVVSQMGTAILSVAAVCGGAILKSVAAVGMLGLQIANGIISKSQEYEHYSVDPDAKNTLFANAAVCHFDVADSRYRPVLQEGQQLAVYHKSASLMADASRPGRIDALLYPEAGNPTASWTALNEAGLWTGGLCGSGNFYFNDDDPERPLLFSLVPGNTRQKDAANQALKTATVPDLLGVEWAEAPSDTACEVWARRQITSNLCYIMYLAAANACAFDSVLKAQTPNAYCEYQMSTPSGVSVNEMLADLLAGGRGNKIDYYGTGFANLIRSMWDNFDYFFHKATADSDMWDVGLVETFDTLANVILSRGMANPCRSAESGQAQTLSWDELDVLINGGVNLSLTSLNKIKDDCRHLPAGYESQQIDFPEGAPLWSVIHTIGARGADFPAYIIRGWCTDGYVTPLDIIFSWFAGVIVNLHRAMQPSPPASGYNGLPILNIPNGFLTLDGGFNSDKDASAVAEISELWYSPGDGSTSDYPEVVRKPMVSPPKFKRGSILGGVILAAIVAAAVVVTAVLVKKKIRNYQKVKAYRREVEATQAAEQLAAAAPGSDEYKKAAKLYVKKQKRFQKYAARVGYSSNSVGSYSTGSSVLDEFPTESNTAEVNPDTLVPITRLLAGDEQIVQSKR